MITLLIIFVIICSIMAYKKDKHNPKQDEYELSRIPSFSIHAKEMGTFSKILNLAVDKSELLQSFSYSNQTISILMQNGKVLTAPLRDLSVDFAKNQGPVTYTIRGHGKKLSFYQTTNISNTEWEAINSVLVLAGSTRGRGIFSKGAKRANNILAAIKIINKLQ